MVKIDIRLKRASKIYYEGELVSGILSVQSPSECAHNGLNISLEGTILLQPGSKKFGVIDALKNSAKPMDVVRYNLDLVKPGRLPSGRTEIPFELPLQALRNRTLYETYHGVFIKIRYTVMAILHRSGLNKDVHAEMEFMLEGKKPGGEGATDNVGSASEELVKFSLSPATVRSNKQNVKLPNFQVSGHFESTNCCITEPLRGECCLEFSDTPIKSIEVQLARVEVCGCADGYSEDCTEIQNIQIAEGDICRNWTIPIYMIFPRIFTCPSLHTPNFKIDFVVNFVVLFQGDIMISERFPIQLFRH